MIAWDEGNANAAVLAFGYELPDRRFIGLGHSDYHFIDRLPRRYAIEIVQLAQDHRPHFTVDTVIIQEAEDAVAVLWTCGHGLVKLLPCVASADDQNILARCLLLA